MYATRSQMRSDPLRSDVVTATRGDHRSTRADAPQRSVLNRGIAMSRNRIVMLCCVLALMAVMAGGAWVAGEQIVSPAEAAARTRRRHPSPILVPIEKRVLSSEIVTRGTARFGTPQPIALAPSPLKANAAGLVTTLPLPNTQFKEGDVMFTASGRPVLVLQGDARLSRHGAGDFRRRCAAARRSRSSEWDSIRAKWMESTTSKTSAAVAKWYKSKGLRAVRPDSRATGESACSGNGVRRCDQEQVGGRRLPLQRRIWP